MASSSCAAAAAQLAKISTDHVHIYGYTHTEEQRRQLAELTKREQRAKTQAAALARRVVRVVTNARAHFVRHRGDSTFNVLEYLNTFALPTDLERDLKAFTTEVDDIIAGFTSLSREAGNTHKCRQFRLGVVGGVFTGLTGVGAGVLILHFIAAVTAVVLPPVGLGLVIAGAAVCGVVAIAAGIAAAVDYGDYRRLTTATASTQKRLQQLCSAHKARLEVQQQARDDLQAAAEPNFECPITLEPLDDPWQTPHGPRMYSYAALERWVNTEHTDPLTRDAVEMSDCRPADPMEAELAQRHAVNAMQLAAVQAQRAAAEAPDDETLQRQARETDTAALKRGLSLFDTMLDGLRRAAEIPPVAAEAEQTANQIMAALEDIGDGRLGRLYRGASVNSKYKLGDEIRGGMYRRNAKRHAKALLNVE